MKAKKTWLLLLAALLLLACGGCAADKAEPGPSSGGAGDEAITISGLPGGPITVTVEELKALPAETEEALSISSSGEESTVPYKGVDINTVLEPHGVSLDDYSGVRLVAADGYSIEVHEDILRSQRLFLAYELYGEPLWEENRPLRVVIPNVRSMYWIKKLREVHLIQGDGGTAVQTLYLAENMPAAAGEAGELDLALLLGLEQDTRVTIIAADGLVKKETLEIGRINYFISREGEDAPEFYSPDIPRTMYVKKVAALIHGDCAYLFAGAFAAEEGAVSGERFLQLLEDYLAPDGIVLHAGEGEMREITAADLAALSFMLTPEGVVLQ